MGLSCRYLYNNANDYILGYKLCNELIVNYYCYYYFYCIFVFVLLVFILFSNCYCYDMVLFVFARFNNNY